MHALNLGVIQVRIYEQLNDYLEINSDYLKSKPYWAGILFRHNNKDLIKFSEFGSLIFVDILKRSIVFNPFFIKQKLN